MKCKDNDGGMLHPLALSQAPRAYETSGPMSAVVRGYGLIGNMMCDQNAGMDKE